MEEKMLATLKQYWGYDAFRPMQREIVMSVVAGRDTLVLMPTGGGKSLTYQLPTMVREGVCIVVTPLIALMKDQVDSLRRRGILAVALHSGLSARQIDVALDNCIYGDVKFLYVAPERLASEMFRERVSRMDVSLIAVDEAHCISQWGYDFRPSYLRIAELRQLVPKASVLALTASATPRVAEDIMAKLEFAEPNILRSSFRRANISYSVRAVEDKREQLMRVVNNVAGCGIVYVRLREAAEKIATFLCDQGISATYYHGGLPYAERTLRQNDWVEGKVRIMVATNAFGMGIDKADVRFVVHYSVCDSLESYYQEAGRAGRDGGRSYAVLLVAPDDAGRMRRRFEMEFPKIADVKQLYEKVCAYLQIAIGDGRKCAYVFNIHEFCLRERLYPDYVLGALKLLQQNEYLTFIEPDEHPARLMFCVSRDDLYKVPLGGARDEEIVRSLLRLYQGVFTEFRAIDEYEIATMSHCSPEQVHECLKRLWRSHIIRYIPANHSPMIYLNEERLPIEDLYIRPETYQLRKELMHERFDSMLAYADEATECRSMAIERYFGSEETEPCGICDNCLARRKRKSDPSPDVAQQIVEVAASAQLTVKELVSRIGGNESAVKSELGRLLDEGCLRLDGAAGFVCVVEQ